jgi:CRISPR system Cascade subunit CasA
MTTDRDDPDGAHMTDVASFDLLDEPWITCLTTDGGTVDVSLLDLFRRATELREIVGDLPTQGFALLRLALAVLHRAVDGPPDERAWHALWRADAPPLDRIEAHLRDHADRFDLFHPETPFLQVAGMRTAKGGFFGLERLIADVPNGHPYFTTRIGRGLEQITPAEAARWLVHAQAFDVSGIKSGIVGDEGRIKGGKVYPLGTSWAGNLGGLYVEGRTVWETLLLNLIPTDQPDLVRSSHRDRASWEDDPPGPTTSPDVAQRPYGPVDLYTWPSRRILLQGDPGGVTGVVVGYGDPLTPQNRHRLEPLTAWRRSTPQEKKLGLKLVYMPKEHDPARALWRGLDAVLPAAAPRGKADDGADYLTAGVVEWVGQALDGDWPVTLRAVGMVYGTQSAVVADVVDDRLLVRLDLIGPGGAAAQQLVVAAVEATEDAVFALRNLASNLVGAAGGTDARLTDGARARASEQAYAALDQPFRRWLSTLGPDTDIEAARGAWHREAARVIHRIGDSLVDGTGPDAWVGREVRGRRVTAPEADGWFRSAVARALPTVPTAGGIA